MTKTVTGDTNAANQGKTANIAYTEKWRSYPDSGRVCIDCDAPIVSGNYCDEHGGERAAPEPEPFAPPVECGSTPLCRMSGKCCFPGMCGKGIAA